MTDPIIPPGEIARLIDMSDDAILVRDLDGRILLWNAGAESLYGYAASEALGRQSHELLRTVFPTAFDAIAACLEETGEWAGELRQWDRDGRELVVRSRWGLLRNREGRAVSALEVNFDMTQQKRAEEALRRSEARFRALFERNVDAVLVTGADGRILMANPAACEMLGRPEDALRGLRSADVIEVTDPRLEEALNGRDGMVRAELRAVRGDGSTFPVDVASSVLEEVDGAVSTSFILRDLTEQHRTAQERERMLRAEKRARRALAQQNRRLRDLDELKDELISTVSHELRTPLTSIQGFLQLLHDEDAGPLTADQRRYVETAEESSKLLLRIVQDLLQLARLDAQGIPLSRQPVDLNAVVRVAVDGLGGAAAAAGMELRVEEGAIEELSADPGALQRVVENLIGNALKFGDAGHPVSVRTRMGDGHALLEVHNVGVPVPKREQRMIFTRFGRGSDAVRRSIGGSGLGLAIVEAIVLAHGGTVSVRSEGRSTTFTVALPTSHPAVDDVDGAPPSTASRVGSPPAPEVTSPNS